MLAQNFISETIFAKRNISHANLSLGPRGYHLLCPHHHGPHHFDSHGDNDSEGTGHPIPQHAKRRRLQRPRTAPIEQSLHGLIITVALASVAAAVATMALVWSIRGNILEMSARAEALVSPPSPQHSPKSRKSSPRDSASTVVCVPHVATPSVIGEVDDLKLQIAAVGTVLQALTVFVPRGGKEGERTFTFACRKNG